MDAEGRELMASTIARRAEQARLVLEVLAEEFEAMRREAHSSFEASDPADAEMRAVAYYDLRAQLRLRRRLEKRLRDEQMEQTNG